VGIIGPSPHNVSDGRLNCRSPLSGILSITIMKSQGEKQKWLLLSKLGMPIINLKGEAKTRMVKIKTSRHQE
jgi:hypothetical protein